MPPRGCATSSRGACSPPGRWTSGTCARWSPMTSPRRRPTSSPGSAAGLTRSALPDGRTTGPSGRPRSPASPSPSRAASAAWTTSGTYGPLFDGWSKSAALQSSLESRLRALGYAVGAADLCAASVGAPHIRQRLFWVADAARQRGDGTGHGGPGRWGESPDGRWLDDPAGARRDGTRPRAEGEARNHARLRGPEPGCAASWLDDSEQPGLEGYAGDERDGHEPGRDGTRTAGPVAASGSPWDNAVWLPCLDGKARRIEPGLVPLVDGVPFRLADGGTVETASRRFLLQGLGNAIVPPVAAAFVKAYLDHRRRG